MAKSLIKTEAEKKAEKAAGTFGGASGMARDAILKRKKELKKELAALENS